MATGGRGPTWIREDFVAFFVQPVKHSVSIINGCFTPTLLGRQFEPLETWAF